MNTVAYTGKLITGHQCLQYACYCKLEPFELLRDIELPCSKRCDASPYLSDRADTT